jgi:hypothetical protein
MRVYNYNHAPLTVFYCLIHVLDSLFSEVLRVEEEVLVAFWITVLVSPLDVHPKNVYWYIVVCKIFVTFDHSVRTDPVPFTEMETKVVQRRQRSKACYYSKVLLNLFDSVKSSVVL